MSSQAKRTSARLRSSSSLEAREGFAVARDGAPIYYRLSGAGDARPTVVLSDGIGCDGFVWKYLERALGERYRILRWHYRGHGRTPAPRTPGTCMADLADDLASVLDTTGIE